MNARQPARLQLVIPCFNEAARLDVDAFTAFTQSHADIELLFVDDGSTDDTAAVLAGLAAASDGRIRVMTLPQNAGKGAAVHRGISDAFQRQPQLVGFWDADLATPLGAIDDFLTVLDAQPEVDIVMGARVKLLGRRVDRNAMRHYTGRVFATAASLALGIGVYDTQCGAKIFRVNEPIREIFAAPFECRWIFDVEILARYTAGRGTDAAGRIYELPLKTWIDVTGSKVRIRHGLRAIWDLARIWRSSANSYRSAFH